MVKLNKSQVNDLYSRIVGGKETAYRSQYRQLKEALDEYKYIERRDYDSINYWFTTKYEASAPVRNAFDKLDRGSSISISDINESKLMDFTNILKNLKYFGEKHRPLYLDISNKDSNRLTIHQVTKSNVHDIIDNLMLLGGLGEDVNGWHDTDTDIMQSIMSKDAVIKMHYGDLVYDNDDIGGYFPYINLDCNIDLSFAGIYTELSEENYTVNCLIHALRQSGALTPEQIEDLELTNLTRYIHTKDIPYIAEKYHLYICVSRYYAGKLRDPTKYGDRNGRLVKLLLRNNHYMLMRDVNVTKYYIQNSDLLKDIPDAQLVINEKLERKENARTPLNYCLTLMFEAHMFKAIDDTSLCENYKAIMPSFENVNYDVDNDTRLFQTKEKARGSKSHYEFGYITELGITTESNIYPFDKLATANLTTYIDSIDKLIDALGDKEFEVKQYRYKPHAVVIGNSVIRTVDKFVPFQLVCGKEFITSVSLYIGDRI